MIYVEIVRRSLGELAVNNIVTRRDLYDQLRSGLNATLDSVEPPIDPKDRELEIRLFVSTVRRLEGDIREGVDIYSTDYDPSELQTVQTKLYSHKTANRVTRMSRAVIDLDQDAGTLTTEQLKNNAYSEARFQSLRQQMQNLSDAIGTVNITREPPLALSTVRAVLLRKLREVSTRNSLGLLWLIAEPTLYVGLIIALYTYLGRPSVMNMEIAPFAVTGVLTMLMFRQTFIRVAAAIRAEVYLLALPPIQITGLALCQGAVLYISFIHATVFILIVIAVFDFGPFPVNWQLAFLIWTAMWLFAVSLGVILAYVSTYTQIIMKSMFILMRFISMCSGIFYVSEQFPEEYSQYLLWNPLLHGLQLLRSAYFSGYKSADASMNFFLCCVGITIIYAAACERLARQRVEPA